MDNMNIGIIPINIKPNKLEQFLINNDFWNNKINCNPINLPYVENNLKISNIIFNKNNKYNIYIFNKTLNKNYNKITYEKACFINSEYIIKNSKFIIILKPSFKKNLKKQEYKHIKIIKDYCIKNKKPYLILHEDICLSNDYLFDYFNNKLYKYKQLLI